MSGLREILPNITTWSEYSQEKQLNFNGYCLATGGEAVLIDPPDLDTAGLSALKDKIKGNPESPLKAILLTNVHHDRSSQKLKKEFSVPILIHEKDKELLEFAADGSFKDGDTLPCGLKAIHLENQKSPGECAFLLQSAGVMFVGDALIGRDKLGQLPPDKFKDIVKAKQGLGKLTNYPFDALLLGDGEPILKDAHKAVVEFVEG